MKSQHSRHDHLSRVGRGENTHTHTHPRTSAHTRTQFIFPRWEKHNPPAQQAGCVHFLGTDPLFAASEWCPWKVKSPRFRTSLPLASQTNFVGIRPGPPGEALLPSLPGSRSPGRSSPARSALPYLGELGDLLAHFHVHLGIAVHSPARASAGFGFGARASPGRVHFAIEGSCHRHKARSAHRL